MELACSSKRKQARGWGAQAGRPGRVCVDSRFSWTLPLRLPPSSTLLFIHPPHPVLILTLFFLSPISLPYHLPLSWSLLSTHPWPPAAPGLTAHKPPAVAAREVLARLHEEAQLLAELSDQAAAVTWLKDGRVLPPGPKYEEQASAGRRALLVRDVGQDDAGLYECVSRGSRVAYQLSVQGEGLGKASQGPRPSWPYCGAGHASPDPRLQGVLGSRAAWGGWEGRPNSVGGITVGGHLGEQ